MSIPECNSIIDNLYLNDQSVWEKTRWLAYINAISTGAKLKSPQDLLLFSWEKEKEDIVFDKPTKTREELKAEIAYLVK